MCKDILNSLARVDAGEYVYSHEYRVLNHHQAVLVENDPILIEFISSNFTKYVMQKAKYLIFRSQR